MSAISELNPKKVFAFFDEICAIPHGSGNTEAISSFLCDFASGRGLRFVRDEVGNVIVYKPASTGKEKSPTVILQAHMDMVAVSKSDLDMTVRGVQPYIDGDYIRARDTSLGGDDGIGVAMIMAVLASDDISHPAIEAVFTIDEETGMDGARALDPALFSGRMMINLDSEEEGHILAGCAGGARVYINKDFHSDDSASRNDITCYKLEISGLAGGHSGNEIHRGGANACVILSRIMYELAGHFDISILKMHGGEVDNAIPNSARAVFGISTDTGTITSEDINKKFSEISENIRAEYHSTDSGMRIELNPRDMTKDISGLIIPENSLNLLSLIISLPNGVISMSHDLADLVETSLNLGVLSLEKGRLTLQYSVRSSIGSAKHALIDRLSAIARLAGADVSISGDYPGWKYDPDSSLRQIFESVYEDMYGTPPVTEVIHAGLECGFFAELLTGLDCVSIGPDMYEIHTVGEHLSISSTSRTWDYLLGVLERI